MKDSMCRLAGKIRPPGGQDWAGYVQEALRSELLMAKRYEGDPEKANMRIGGTLQKATFNSNQGYWDLALRLNFPDGSHLREEVRYEFDPSFIGNDACDGVADAYAPAVDSTWNCNSPAPDRVWAYETRIFEATG